MRMWMVDPSKMCRQHLLGEHLELHMFVNVINTQKHSVLGYMNNNLLEPKSIGKRHMELVREMKRRGYNHKSPIEKIDLRNIPKEMRGIRINTKKSSADLIGRCKTCSDLSN